MKAVIIASLCLAACDQQSTPEREESFAERAANQRARDNPAGAFQMMPAGQDNDLVLLDTRTGTLRRCWFRVNDQLKITCGDPYTPS